VKKVVEDLRSSCVELKGKVEDPLPEAIKFANEVAESLRRKERENQTSMRVDMDAPENFKGKDVLSTQGEGGGRTEIPKRSLMDRQPTAFQYQVIFLLLYTSIVITWYSQGLLQYLYFHCL
jgi:ornithine carbamoyltransferase